MRRRILIPVAGILPLFASALCAQSATPRARDLYLEENGPGASAAIVPVSGSASSMPSVNHLGLRYTLLKIDPATRATQVVDPDENYKAGDCFAIDLVPNREGELYIFNLGSSGKWSLLLPSSLMPDETAKVKSGSTVKVPQEYCFRLDDQKGVEKLIVAVTENREDIDRLHASLRASVQADGNIGDPGETANGMKTVSAQVQEWQQDLGSRDLVIEKVDQPESDREQPNSVYAVRISNADAGRLVIQIKIRHE